MPVPLNRPENGLLWVGLLAGFSCGYGQPAAPLRLFTHSSADRAWRQEIFPEASICAVHCRLSAPSHPGGSGEPLIGEYFHREGHEKGKAEGKSEERESMIAALRAAGASEELLEIALKIANKELGWPFSLYISAMRTD